MSLKNFSERFSVWKSVERFLSVAPANILVNDLSNNMLNLPAEICFMKPVNFVMMLFDVFIILIVIHTLKLINFNEIKLFVVKTLKLNIEIRVW